MAFQSQLSTIKTNICQISLIIKSLRQQWNLVQKAVTYGCSLAIIDGWLVRNGLQPSIQVVLEPFLVTRGHVPEPPRTYVEKGSTFNSKGAFSCLPNTGWCRLADRLWCSWPAPSGTVHKVHLVPLDHLHWYLPYKYYEIPFPSSFLAVHFKILWDTFPFFFLGCTFLTGTICDYPLLILSSFLDYHLIFPGFPPVFPTIILWSSQDYPWIIPELSRNPPEIIPWLSLDYYWIVPGLSQDDPYISPSFSVPPCSSVHLPHSALFGILSEVDNQASSSL